MGLGCVLSDALNGATSGRKDRPQPKRFAGGLRFRNLPRAAKGALIHAFG
jgi:hypothetical protein